MPKTPANYLPMHIPVDCTLALQGVQKRHQRCSEEMHCLPGPRLRDLDRRLGDSLGSRSALTMSHESSAETLESGKGLTKSEKPPILNKPLPTIGRIQ